MNYSLWILLLWGLPGWALAGSCNLLILGDSLSSGYGLAAREGWADLLDVRLNRAAPQWRVVNASISGDTTQNGLQRLGPALQRHHPQGVLIALGGNDALRGTPPTEIRQNLAALVRQARASGAWVLLLEAPVLPNYGPGYAGAVAKLYGEVAHAERAVHVPCFVCGVGVRAALMQADGIHPNAQAQAAMLDAVWPYLKPKLRCTAK